MFFAARFTDTSIHGGKITLVIPSNKVLIEGVFAATVDALHTCPIPPPPHAPAVSKFVSGRPRILIQGRPALSVADSCGCTAISIPGAGSKKVLFS
jgi:uncharacterized Zn-binding protein involved in type VI secretion